MGVQKRWSVQSVNHDKAGALFKGLRIHPVLCSILVQRGIDSFEAARRFFRPQLADLHDPF
ncbi:MAG TPA: single-stranded-DNA-specific exonuclease RecJ, partial [Flavisolibacter sp.]|nr:single-stranded-DNA-specific exonuclease RecJ [Flavisolibacter sp.]